MISMKFCSTALTGQPVDMTVSQNGVKRALSVEAFGVPKAPPVAPAPSARLTISLRRGQQQVAPEGIAFFANVSGFDAEPGFTGVPASGEVYDEAMHDITYVWDFGDKTAPANAYERMLTQWRDNNVGYGPWPSHVFATPGTYTVLCGAYERSSGKQAFASVSVTVADPNVFFTEANTICIAPDGNFTGAPTSVAANRVTSIAAANSRHAALLGAGQPIRVLYKSGATHPMTGALSYSNSLPNLYIGTWGGNAHAIVTVAAGADGGYGVGGNYALSGAIVHGIDFRGYWDSTDPASTNTYVPKTFMWTGGGFNTIYNCKASGVDTGYSTGYADNRTTIFANCSVENWKNIGFWSDDELPARDNAALPMNSYVALVGCRATQNVQATMNGNSQNWTPGTMDNDMGPIRTQGIAYLHIDGFEAFSRNGWSRRDKGWPASQAIVRDHRNDPRSRGFISRMFGEGAFEAYTLKDAQGRPNKPTNTVIDKFYMLGSAETAITFTIACSCCTIRNGIVHRPNKGSGGSNGYRAGVVCGDLANKQTPENTLYPVKVYNVTFVNELSNAEDSSSWLPVEVYGGYWAEGQIRQANNVVHRPNFTGGFVGDMPLDTTKLGIAPRFLGYKWLGDFYLGWNNVPPKMPMDTSYATPANPMSLWRPLPGSPAIAGATGGMMAYDDMLGKVRPAQASRGATEPA